MLKKIASALIAAMVLTVVAGCGGSKPAAPAPAAGGAPAAAAPKIKAREIKMGITAADTSTWTDSAKKFKEIVEQETGGAVQVGLFPNSQLASGNQTKELEMLQSGAIDMTITSTIFYSGFEPKMTAVSMPFLFANYEQVDKFLNGPLGQEIMDLVKAKGITGLALGENGFRQLSNSKRAVKTVDDVKGLKIRIPGMQMYTTAWKAMGANPVTMSFGEVFGALQQKVVDGQENDYEIFASSKFYEVQKYMTVWNYSYGALIYGINTKTYESYEPELKAIVAKAAKEAAAYQIKLNRGKDDANLKTIKEKGVDVYVVPAEELAKFKAATEPAYKEFEPIVGKDLLDKFKALTK
jgi:TRAP-type transport system periplasmic protein